MCGDRHLLWDVAVLLEDILAPDAHHNPHPVPSALQLCLGLPRPVTVHLHQQIEPNSPALGILQSTLTALCAGGRGHIHLAQRIDGAHPSLASAQNPSLMVLCAGGKCSMPVSLSCRGSGLASGGCQEPRPCDSGV